MKRTYSIYCDEGEIVQVRAFLEQLRGKQAGAVKITVPDWVNERFAELFEAIEDLRRSREQVCQCNKDGTWSLKQATKTAVSF